MGFAKYNKQSYYIYPNQILIENLSRSNKVTDK